MTLPKKPKFKSPFQGKSKIRTTGKAYLRNFGKGELKIAEDSVKFYVVKGRFSKQKDLVKQFQFADVEKVTLLRGELDVTLRYENLRFVIKDKKFASFSHGKISEYLNKTIQPQAPAAIAATEPLTTGQKTSPISAETTLTAKTEPASPTSSSTISLEQTPFPAPSPPATENLEKENVGEAVTLAFSAADSLFDTLVCLHERVDWRTLWGHAKLVEDKIRKLAAKKLFAGADLDGSLFLSSVAERDVAAITQEGQRLLDTLIRSFQNEQSELWKAKNAANAYFILNDIVFATAVGDTDINEEVTALTVSLSELPDAAKVKTQSILEPLAQLVKEGQREPYVDQARTAFNKQLSTMLAT